MDLKKNQIYAQNPLVLAYGFSKNSQFVAKINRSFIFIGRDPHILNRLYIIVLYMSFYVF
jgi:hypothetical protein